ncbi:MAG: L-2-amino-thiazoline-4-carboxylic acid hydrolase [Armatimonadota bacterium]|nr:L-2-amino-thiazoline-4-carboxylic acid hydrolase [Armatimonadota bacterium]
MEPCQTTVGTLRPHRVQKQVCRAAVADVLGPAVAEVVLQETGIADLPETLPAAPRDLAALAAELAPFVALYRALLHRCDRQTALRIVRRAIVESGLIGHAHAAQAPPEGPSAAQSPRAAPAADPSGPGLSLTSPPPPGFHATPATLREQFDVAMRYFSCEGRLLAYTPEYVRFHVTRCNWVRAMEQAGVPELIPFFCETDERFMDRHPTHRLDRPTAIGLGDPYCDFQFVPRAGGSTSPPRGDAE